MSFKIKRSNEFWRVVSFPWVDEEGETETRSIRFRFKRLKHNEYAKEISDLNNKVDGMSRNERLLHDNPITWLTKLVVDVEDGVEIEGVSGKPELIKELLSYTTIMKAVAVEYQNSLIDGGANAEAVKK